MNIKPDCEMISENEISLFNYWKVFVKRRKVFLSIFFIPLLLAAIISLSLPRYYSGKSEITRLIVPAPNIIRLIGEIDEAKKMKIFAGSASAIKSVSLSFAKKSSEKLDIVIDAKTADIVPQAMKEILNYINTIPGIETEILRAQAEIDLKTTRLIEATELQIKKLIEARKANTIFLNLITEMIRKGQTPLAPVNPADLIKKDADLSLEIMRLQQTRLDTLRRMPNEKVLSGVLGPLEITKQPSRGQIIKITMFTGILSFLAGFFVVFLLEYIGRMKVRVNI